MKHWKPQGFNPEFPSTDNCAFVLGGSLSTTTDTWTLGLNFDLVKGSNDAFQQVGTLHILGRI